MCVFSERFRVADELDLREYASVCHIGDAKARPIEDEDENDMRMIIGERYGTPRLREGGSSRARPLR